jgi:hypothetical protein
MNFVVIPGLRAAQNPTAFAGTQTRTPQVARRASAMDGASQSILISPRNNQTQNGFRLSPE